MTGGETRGALGGLVGAATELLKNKTVLEALIAGIGAFSAANKVKNKNSKTDSFDFSGLLDMLPQIMPLLGLLTQSEGGIFGVSNPTSDLTDAVPTLADADDGDEASEAAESTALDVTESEAAASYNVSYGSKTENRESLLLALRPFLSESRAAAADAIIQVNRISGFLG